MWGMIGPQTCLNSPIFRAGGIQAAFLAVAAIVFHYIPIRSDLTLEATNIGQPAYLVLASMLIFVVFYSLGIGNLAWVSSDFFPIEIWALGTMMVIHDRHY
jgi:SP family myo-inositol transporter-like MFS transporter 13